MKGARDRNKAQYTGTLAVLKDKNAWSFPYQVCCGNLNDRMRFVPDDRNISDFNIKNINITPIIYIK